MSKIDPFSAQLVALVRSMPDEAILALVRDQLGAVAAPAKKRATKPAPKKVVKRVVRKTRKKVAKRVAKKPAKAAPKKRVVKKAAKKKAVKKARAPRGTTAARAQQLAKVEKFVKSSKGVSLAQVAAATKLSKPQAAGVIRALKQDGKIHQGGDRRFARYGASKKAAEKASLAARQGQ